ncbi:MAG: hypothetical protein PHF26_03555, partial [Candidatus Gracilibacteria bacterium]|nr:hypothetical protein [Candidatus Gracilibacteria bacterium]
IFGDITKGLDIEIDKKDKKPLDKVEIGYKISSVTLTLVILFTILCGLNNYLRTTEDNKIVNDYFKFLCPYLSNGIEGYDNNNDCLTLPNIVKKLEGEQKNLEKSLRENLGILILLKYEKANILNSPRVLFIKEKNGDDRIQLTKEMDDFNKIIDDTNYQVDCKGPKLNEKGSLGVNCDFYGVGILSPGHTLGSSRMTLLKFLKNFEDSTYPFSLNEYPKTLSILDFTSEDTGIKSTFSTKTSMELKLTYKNNK